MARNQQVLRQWRLWRLLASSRDALSAEQLAEKLEPDRVTARTVRRDLEVLRSVGVPVRELRQGRELRYAAHDDGPELRLDADTLLALRLALGLLRPFEGTAVGESLAQLERRLEARVPPRLLSHFAPLTQSVTVRSDAPPAYGPAEGVFARVREALTLRRVLEFDYESADGRRSQRRVHPQALVYGPRGLYLLALDESRSGELRTFRLERMERAKLAQAPATRDPAFDAEEHLAGSLGIFSPEHEPRLFRIRVHTQAAARILRENPWHVSQRLERKRRGCWELSLELTSSRELVARVLAFGADLEVLESRELREEVGGILARAASRYPERPRVARRSRSQSVQQAG